jgi:hypothetical protein
MNRDQEKVENLPRDFRIPVVSESHLDIDIED